MGVESIKNSWNREEVEKLLDDCWEASDEYNDQLTRISVGLSNFDKPTYPDKETWIKQNL